MVSADTNAIDSLPSRTAWCSVPSRTIAQKTKKDEETVELTMNDAVFSEFVKNAVENKTLIPRYHPMLTAKLSDYELRWV